MTLTPADLGPALEAQWRALPAKPPERINWAVAWWPAPDPRPRRLCRACARPMDPVITEDAHPLCDPRTTQRLYTQATRSTP